MVFVNEKAKMAKNALKKKVTTFSIPDIGTPEVGSPVLEFLQVEKCKAGC